MELFAEALSGLKVVEFSASVAGPVVGKCLADHGATVVKVESRRAMDVARRCAPFASGTGPNRSGVFANFNSSKLSIALDLKQPAGLAIAKRLVGWADVMLENFRAGVLERIGLGYEALRAENERLILLSMGSQGQTGPFATQPGFGWNLNALSGFSHMTGWPDRAPVGPGVAYPDAIAPWYGVIATLAALEYRGRTGAGQHIDLSQLEATVGLLAPTILNFTANGREDTRDGNRSARAAPHGAYKTADEKWCALAVFDNGEWRALCAVMGKADLDADARFASVAARKHHEEQLDAIVADWTAGFAASEVVARLQAAGIAAGVVQSTEDLLDHDAQLRHRQYFKSLEQPEMGQFRHSGWPARLSATPGEARMPAPTLGEHTAQVCTEILGMSDVEFVGLLDQGIFD